MGGREVPIHLELNSVASRVSRAAIHPAAGSCRSPGDATGAPAPAATLGLAVMLGKGENTQAWTDTRETGVCTAPGFYLWVIPMACWGIFGRSRRVDRAWRCIARRWCWDPAPLALARHGPGCWASGTLRFPGSHLLWGAVRGGGRRCWVMAGKAGALCKVPMENQGAMDKSGKDPSLGTARQGSHGEGQTTTYA